MSTETVYQLFEQQVMLRPDDVAVADEQRSVTFAQLDALAQTVQEALPRGVQRVGVVMDHGVAQIAAILGILRAGAAYIPAEPRFPDAHIHFTMSDGGASCLVTQAAYASRFEMLPCVLVEPDMQPSASAAGLVPATPEPDSLAYVLYTSGSTGLPKGVAVEQRNVCHYVRAFQHEFRLGPDDIMLQHSVCSFDIFVEEMFGSLLNGASLAVPAPGTRRDITALMRFIQQNGVTVVSSFPYLLMRMNDLPSTPSCLRLLISGGDVLRAGYIDKLVQRTTVYNTYGPSETTVCATYFRCNGTQPLPDGTYPIGHSVLGSDVQILDDHLQPVPAGQVGEICIGGGGLSRGYIGNADKQRSYFTTLPDGTPVYRSGDMGRQLPSGDIVFLHRKDSQVMVWGRRVEPEGVENVLCSCNGVKTGAVRALRDERDLPYLVAYYVTNANITAEELRAQMAQRLPEYMIPECLVELPDMPLTPNGKVDDHALPHVERPRNEQRRD